MPRYVGEIKVVFEADDEDAANDLFEELVVDHVQDLQGEDDRVIRFYGVDVSEDA